MAVRVCPPAVASVTILVIAKECLPGKVKTRLVPPLSPVVAASLAAASLADTLSMVAALPVARRILVFDGRPPSNLANFEVIAQVKGGLDERISAAFEHCSGPTLLLGMDTPQVTAPALASVFAGADRSRTAWFGPARDGGFWALGFTEPRPELVRGVPMSRSDTGAIQRRRLLDAGLNVVDLAEMRDVDTIEDAYAVAAAAPGSAFAREVDRLRATPLLEREVIR
jgi:hypothetical protein